MILYDEEWSEVHHLLDNLGIRPDELTEYTVKLSEDYVATVDNGGIHVGCESFSFDKFDELKKTVKKFKKSKKT